jgi:serine/threonine protein kinase/tetratricopeptide (TPR) repeat protein
MTASESRMIGAYRVLRELGRGGMGIVYLAARADEQYEKQVTIKVIKAGADNKDLVRHFRRERQILASLDHPNIAKLLDGGATEDGLPFFVMEHILGQPIDEHCDSHTLSTTDRLKIFRDVCSAVQYAHRNLIVHRDLKPSNIIVTPEGVPKLLDFGIAKLLTPELLAERSLTGTGIPLFTPEYASPEQTRGEPITTATDVYSLGVVLYELLTGHRPYRLKGQQPLEVMKAVTEEEPEKPSTAVDRTEPGWGPRSGSRIEVTPDSVSRVREATPEKLKRQLAGDLDDIVLMALRKEPHLRYPSVEAFSEDIRRFMEGLPVTARKGTLAYRTRKFLRRNRLGLTVAATIVLLLGALGVNTAIQSSRVSRALAKAEKERTKAERVASFLVDLFKVSDPSEARGNTVTAREMLDKGSAKTETELKDEPEVRATLMDTMGRVYLNLGLYDKALPLLQEALKVRKAVLGNDHLDVAKSLSNLAELLRDRGDFTSAEALYREALAVRRKLLGNEHPDVATNVVALAVVFDDEGNYPGAEALYREALAMQRKLLGNEHTDVARTLNNLANVLDAEGDFAGAETLYRETLTMLRKFFGNEHPAVAIALSNLANTLDDQGDYAGSEALNKEALAMRRKILGNEHPSVAENLANLGNALLDKGDTKGAEPLEREALAMRRKLLGSEHPDVAESLVNLANVLLDKGDYAGAEKLYREALAMQRKLLGSDHPSVAGSLIGLAAISNGSGKPAQGEAFAREGLAVREKGLPKGHPDTAEAESILGACLVAEHRYDEAEPLLLGSSAILKAKRTERSRQAREALQRLVQLYEAWGKPEKVANLRATTKPIRPVLEVK